MGSVAVADAGAQAGVAEWYWRWGAELHTYCSRLLGNRDDADDVTQEVFLAALRQRARLCSQGEPLNVRAWLYRVATNRCRDLLRRRRLISWVPLATWRETTAARDPVAEATADADMVRRALGRLSARDAALVVPWGAQGFSYREVADVLSLAPSSAASAISRAHQRFARHYAALAKEDQP